MKKNIAIILIIICILFVFISGIIYIRNKEKIPVLFDDIKVKED